VISQHEVRETIKKREDMQMKFKRDFDKSFKTVSSQIESHGKKLISKITLMVNRRVNSLVDYMKECGETELKSFNEVTDTFKALLEAHEQSDTRKNDINFYNRDLLIQFLAEKFEINLEFVSSKYFAPYDLSNFCHFEIDGNICSDLQYEGMDEAQNVDRIIADVEHIKEPSLKRRRIDDHQPDQVSQHFSSITIEPRESEPDDGIALQQIKTQIIGQIKAPNQLRDTTSEELVG